ncbi:hypothetical protein [Legionella jamestowniensis]|nr:hypothetical protein [Legionella jamestowniensis]
MSHKKSVLILIAIAVVATENTRYIIDSGDHSCFLAALIAVSTQ